MTYCLNESGKTKTCRVLFALLFGLGLLASAATAVCAPPRSGFGSRSFGGGVHKPPFQPRGQNGFRPHRSLLRFHAQGHGGFHHHFRHHRRPGYILRGGMLVPVGPSGGEGIQADGAGMVEADDGGVLLTAVARGAAADRAGLRVGDVILSFGGVRTRTFEELQDAVQQASGAVQVVFVNGENGQTESCTVAPQQGLIGVTCE